MTDLCLTFDVKSNGGKRRAKSLGLVRPLSVARMKYAGRIYVLRFRQKKIWIKFCHESQVKNGPLSFVWMGPFSTIWQQRNYSFGSSSHRVI